MNKPKSTRRATLAKAVLSRLIDGTYPPGSRFPTCDELMREFSVSRSTVQQVLRKLSQDGFVVTDGRRGTKVTPYPPHLHRFAMVFPVTTGRTNRFWTTLKEVAKASSDATDVQWDYYFDVDQHVDNPAYQQLTRDITSMRTAGLVMMADPYLSMETPDFREFDVPKVRLLHASAPDAPLIDTDTNSFISLSVERLRSRGCRRIAVVHQPLAEPMERFKQEILGCGMETYDHWLQMVALEHPEVATRIMQLLFSGAPASRPDGLIIADDNLMEYALSGVLSAGVNIPGDVQVVAHCNWPQALPSAVPIDRLGYDVRAFLRLACTTLRDIRQHITPPALQMIPATFEPEK